MNVFIQAVGDNDGLVSTDGAKMFTNIGQVDETGNFFPFSCSGTEPYAIITAISCDGCSSIMNVMCTGTATVILQ
uniref:Uncharacterized protein n=1 Tax=Acrobeloides nanus TaxID=290746 RepID=A0A914DSQ1_9BILA